MKEISQAQIRLHMRIPVDTLDEFCREISRGEKIDRLEIEKKEQIVSNILDRSPLRQTEFLDVIIAFFVNITAAAAWEASKVRLAHYAKRNNAEILEVKIQNPPSLPPHQPTEVKKTRPTSKKTSIQRKPRRKR